MYVLEATVEYFISIAVGTVYLAKLTAYMGLSDALTGILSAFVSLGCGFQLFAIVLSNRRPVKRWVTLLHVVSQTLFASIYLVPVVPISKTVKTVIFVAMLLLAHIIHNIINSPKINWFMTLIDDEKRGRFTANKEIVSLLTGIVFSYLLGFVIDYFEAVGNLRLAFIVCGVGLLVMMGIHTATLLLSKEKEEDVRSEKISLGVTVKNLFNNKGVFKITLLSVLWHLASSVTFSFTGTYQAKELAFTTTYSSIIIMVGCFIRALFSFPFGKIADKFSFRVLLNVCYIIEIFAFGINIFTNPNNGTWLYFVFYVLYSVGMAGINSATINLIYDYVDREQRIGALAIQQTCAGLAGFLVTLIVSPVITAMQKNGNTLFGCNIYAQQILSAVSFIIVIIALAFTNTGIKKLRKNTDKRKMQKASWIWNGEEVVGDEYGEFYAEFFVESKENLRCFLSVDSDYALYINGKLAACNQYGDYEWYKCYDEIDLTPFVTEGENHFALLVYHCGVANQRYYPAKAGAIFEVYQGEKLLLFSGEHILSRRSKAYKNGAKKWVSRQLGFSFAYDATKEDDWHFGEGEGFYKSVTVDKQCVFYPRPVKKSWLLPPSPAKMISKEGDTSFLIDLGQESVGLLSLSFYSEKENPIVVAYGEHLVDGHVVRRLGSREWSVEYTACAGKNEYVHPILRLGCRYLEVSCQSPITVEYIGLLPQVIPVKEKPFKMKDEEEQAIYDVCVRTLNLCMMEHYVDCPWREQDLYVFDAKNQMLCGYYAFEDGNFDYARANLLLMSKDRREDELLSICFPCGADLTIPSFSLYYFMAVEEYVRHSGDVAFIEEVWDKLQTVLGAFFERLRDGLVYTFEGKNHWNFYDWSQGLEGKLFEEEEPHADLMVNCLLALALDSLKTLAQKAKKPFAYDAQAAELKKRIKERFYNEEDGLFSLLAEEKAYTELGNALAIFAGLTTKDEESKIVAKIKDKALSPCSLSMKVFVYEALIAHEESNIGFVLSEIKKTYGKMLAAGATSVWETENGSVDFGGSGSLCHGWSAIPIYFYHKRENMSQAKNSQAQ